jgi:hypothetical protein
MSFGKPSPAMVVAIIAVVAATGGTAYAASGQLVNIVDPGNAAQAAKVDAAGKLNVGDGSGALTVDGTTTSRESPPSTLFHSFTFPPANGACVPLATPDAGKALVIKSVTLDTFVIDTAAAGRFAGLWLGANGCENLIMEINPPGVGLLNQPFEPGLGVPAGQRLWIFGSNITSQASAFGYSVPANAVPVPAVSATASAKARALQARTTLTQR